MIDEYIKYIRPLLKPLCDFLLVNRNGLQFSKLTDLMSNLVYDAIGKYIHLTRYRQLVHISFLYMNSFGSLKIKNTVQLWQEFITKGYAQEMLPAKDKNV